MKKVNISGVDSLVSNTLTSQQKVQSKSLFLQGKPSLVAAARTLADIGSSVIEKQSGLVNTIKQVSGTSPPQEATTTTTSTLPSSGSTPSDPISKADDSTNKFTQASVLNNAEESLTGAITLQEVIKQNENKSFEGLSFEIGFDDIKFGQVEYSSKSIYVSRTLEMVDPLQVGFKAVEKRPASLSITSTPEMVSDTYDDMDDTNFYHASIEYWLIKTDYDNSNKIIASYKIPILPTGVTRVNHERLILTDRFSTTSFLSDIGALMFFADETNSDIKIYRNGIILNSSEWSFANDELSSVPNSGNRMSTKIRIHSVLPGDIYTASYNPSESTTVSIPGVLSEYNIDGISVVDLAGDLSARLVSNKLVLLEKGPKADRIVKSTLQVCIILRNNAGNTSITPTVEEYTLVASERDVVKFSEDNF